MSQCAKKHTPGSLARMRCPDHGLRSMLSRGRKQRAALPSLGDLAERHPDSRLPIIVNGDAQPGHHNVGINVDQESINDDWDGTVFEDCHFGVGFLSSDVHINRGTFRELGVAGGTIVTGLKAAPQDDGKERALNARDTARLIECESETIHLSGDAAATNCVADKISTAPGRGRTDALVPVINGGHFALISHGYGLAQDTTCESFAFLANSRYVTCSNVHATKTVTLSASQLVHLGNITTDGVLVVDSLSHLEDDSALDGHIIIDPGTSVAWAFERGMDQYAAPPNAHPPKDRHRSGARFRITYVDSAAGVDKAALDAPLMRDLLTRTDDLHIDGRNEAAWDYVLSYSPRDADRKAVLDETIIRLALALHSNP